jgi:hypothetical protein
MASREALREQRARDIRTAGATRRTAGKGPKSERETRALMRPDNAPTNRAVAKPVDGGLRSGRRDQRALSSGVTTRNIGPKPKRGDYKTDRSFQTAVKRWESKRANPAAGKPKATEAKKDAAAVSRGGSKAPSPKAAAAKSSAKQDKAAASRSGTKKPSAPSARGKEVSVYKGPRSTKSAEREPIDLKTRPVPGSAGTGGRKAIGATAEGREVATRSGSALVKRSGGTVAKRPQAGALAVREAERKAAAGIGFNKKQKAAVAAAGLAGLGYALGGDSGKKTDSPGGAAAGAPSKTVRDKYGRKISREEYNRREKFRQKTYNKSGAELEKLRKAESKRRAKYRKTEGSSQFGEDAKKKTRNQNVRGWVSVRGENRRKTRSREERASGKSKSSTQGKSGEPRKVRLPKRYSDYRS